MGIAIQAAFSSGGLVSVGTARGMGSQNNVGTGDSWPWLFVSTNNRRKFRKLLSFKGVQSPQC